MPDSSSSQKLQFVRIASEGYTLPMRDRFFYPLMALIAAAMIALALVWPQGLGEPSPEPFRSEQPR